MIGKIIAGDERNHDAVCFLFANFAGVGGGLALEGCANQVIVTGSTGSRGSTFAGTNPVVRGLPFSRSDPGLP